MIKRTVKAFTFGQMEELIVVLGKTESNMESDFISS